MFKGSDYPKRLPIGKEEVIANFPYDVLRNFYKKWHRPDLTAIIVVGDIDPETIEKFHQREICSLCYAIKGGEAYPPLCARS